MTDEVPPDVAEELARLLATARDRTRRGETESVRHSLDTIESLVTSSLSDGDLRDRLLHGCEQVDYLTGDDPLAAAEYCRAMHDLVVDSTSGDLSEFDFMEDGPDNADDTEPGSGPDGN